MKENPISNACRPLPEFLTPEQVWTARGTDRTSAAEVAESPLCQLIMQRPSSSALFMSPHASRPVPSRHPMTAGGSQQGDGPLYPRWGGWRWLQDRTGQDSGRTGSREPGHRQVATEREASYPHRYRTSPLCGGKKTNCVAILYRDGSFLLTFRRTFLWSTHHLATCARKMCKFCLFF